MKSSVVQSFVMFLLWILLCGYAEKDPTPEGIVEDVRKPELLEDIATTEAFISSAEVAVIGFFKDSERPDISEFLTMIKNVQEVSFGICTSPHVLSHYNITGNTMSLFRVVDNKRHDLEMEDIEGLDASKLSRFVQMHGLHWVTDYNPMTAVGLFDSTIEVHLLLFADKLSPNHTERINKYREAAQFFQGKVLFIFVDIHLKGNDRVLSYFHLKKSQLPALAAFHTPDEEYDVLHLNEVSVATVKDFCNGFLQKQQEKENPNSKDKAFKEEL
ncbi:hypothetical protein JRQ81_016146 [Phrynocephalus forsythii]|uniref:Endoplasmic reticulum resident protein 27 n=1 Tax=Phrynocephalus forsythii TaxID=171643 RepID=A0A9Q1B2Y6_9SAUR|nr:hypothetical protein JRQ81_016146 [Phrynocephalus forsythii]